MKEYIDKAAVIEEIERLIETNKGFKKTWKWKFKWFYRTIVGRLEVLEGLKIFLSTLEVKEVDLEKEIKRFTMSKELYEADSVIKAVAEHFFELGLKTQKR